MNTITRRAALGGLALLTGGAATIAAAAPTSPPADAELMQLGRELAIAEQAFHDACEAEAQAYKRWEELRPQPHPDIIEPRKYNHRMQVACDYNRVADPRGKTVPNGEFWDLRVADPASLRASIAADIYTPEMVILFRRMITHAERFWSDLEKADEQSGASMAGFALRQIWCEVDRIAAAVFAHQAASIAGVAVMARAAVMSDLCRSTCMFGSVDHRFVAIAASVNAMAEARS